ncbi:MAG: glutamine amidotransferase [Nocardiopsaceae bacterium]|jgi:CobQ-like glutamine amidotransferase family enzyme|nr:glutamine amidotransferase [Nocardiopsaceae bacterium]
MTPAAPVTVRICHLYPRLLSVAGDRGNLFALTQRCAWRGIGYRVTEADAGDAPDFAQTDLILMHGGQDREMRVAARDLAAKGGPLADAIEAGTVVLAVCAGYQLLGRYYAPVDGPPIEGLGVLDAVAEGGRARFIGHALVECDPGPGGQRHLTGFENHSGRTYLGSGARPLGRMLAGAGNNGEDGTEGARYREVYATYLHGPLLPKNPWLTDHLLTRALAHRYQDFGPLAPLADQAETQAHAASLRLARRPAGRWRVATAAVSRFGRPPAPLAGRAHRHERSLAGKGTAWTSH